MYDNKRGYESRYYTILGIVMWFVWAILVMTMVAKGITQFVEKIQPMYQDLVEVSESLSPQDDILE